MQFIETYLSETKQILENLDKQAIGSTIHLLAELRKSKGRLFVLGIGGSAANASHLVNDIRKIVGIEAYAPTDNIAELTARTNDNGWASIFSDWLAVSRLQASDALFILSVGGGSTEKNVSPNLVAAIDYAKTVGAKIMGIVGHEGGYTAKHADAAIVVPALNAKHITPHTEAFQAVIWHLLVSHPLLKAGETKWESLNNALDRRELPPLQKGD